MLVIPFNGKTPVIHETAFLAEGSVIIGDVEIGAEAGIWFNAVLRGDVEPIRIGRRTNVQDGAVIHTDPGCPCIVGESVTVGHNVILHGCRVGDGATVGMGATVLNRASVGEEAFVAANALVLEDTNVPARMLVAGLPARPKRELTKAQAADFRKNADGYVRRAAGYLEARKGRPAH